MEKIEKMNSKTKAPETNEFDDKVHKLGVSTTLLMWVFFLAVPLGVTLFFGLNVNILQTLSIAAPLSIAIAITGLAEKLSITPVIGPGAMYLASATGNVQNMKLPAALNAMRLLDAEPGSEKGRVISIIAVATSAVVTTIILFLGMLFLAPLATPLLTNPVVAPAFDNMLPALLGPMVIPIVLSNPKSAPVPFIYSIIFVLILGDSYGTLQSLVLVAVILLTLGTARIFFNKDKNTEQKHQSIV